MQHRGRGQVVVGRQPGRQHVRAGRQREEAERTARIGGVGADTGPVDREPPGVHRRQHHVGRDPGGQQDSRQSGRAVELQRPRHDADGHDQGENARVRVADRGPQPACPAGILRLARPD
jgi:hypothetical protein